MWDSSSGFRDKRGRAARPCAAERNAHLVPRRLRPRHPALAAALEEVVSHVVQLGVLRALGRVVLWSSLHGAALAVELDRVLGGAWAGQFIMTGVYISCYYVVCKSVDVWFALEVGPVR